MSDLSLSIILPCYNEAGNVERTVTAAIRACSQFSGNFEVVLVNDGSTDQTGLIADQMKENYACVRVVHNPSNLGYGGALREGFRVASKDMVFYTDGDGQFDCAEIARLLPLLTEFDIVSAYRLNRQESLCRKWSGWAWTKLMNILFHMKIRDVDCAFKLMPRHALAEMNLQSFGALIGAEILAKAQRLGYRTGQIGVTHYPRLAEQATGGSVGVVLRAFKELRFLYSHIRQFSVDKSAAHSAAFPPL